MARLCYRSGLLAPLRYLRDLRHVDVRILAYHRVLDIADERDFDFDLALVSADTTQFRQQMEHIRRRYHPICLRDWCAARREGRELPSRPVIVTFDDGYDDNYRIAFPILRELGIPGVFFVSTGHIDSGAPYAYDWLVHMLLVTRADRIDAPEIGIDESLPAGRADRRTLAGTVLSRMKWLDAAAQSALIERLETQWQLPRSAGHPDCRPMSWDQLRDMRDGGMEIGGHGVSHRMLAKLPANEIHDELSVSKSRLDAELGPSPYTLSYPVGNIDAWSETVVEEARTAGFSAGCSYVTGTNPIDPPDWWALKRLPVERDMDLPWFVSMVALPEAFSYPSQLRTVHS